MKPRESESPLDAPAAGTQATEAFELLSDETRLAILVALWEHADPFGDDDAVRFLTCSRGSAPPTAASSTTTSTASTATSSSRSTTATASPTPAGSSSGR
ncbi:hypothetical protein [Halobacterium sp. CBA1126]|uniref:hypothetical protein n=1 Tax=Halobacterium sp. CBA1126 TaxID=2668074 RepID=UPI0012F70C53|nr:hypothetical protein [Halobacterium sp. CBA1126]MUV60221.1 hypothetical protein [Halobacterium sp. CBA1126]